MSLSRDMTIGSETGNIIRFSLPLLFGNLLQQTYNIADTAIVGRFLGDDALASVGATGSITYLFYTLCIGLSIGAGIIISQFFGAGMRENVKSSVFNSAVVTAIFGAVISIFSVLLTKPILNLLMVPENLIDGAADYMRIACGGTIFVAAYNWINSVMRAIGNSKTPLIFLIAASLINVGLDLLFVVVIGMGISGAAFATVLAQGISALGCIIYSFKFNSVMRLSKKHIKVDKDLIIKCIRTGIPIAAQNGMVSVSMVALQRVTNTFGETVMAAYTVSMRIEQFVQQPFSSLNAAISTFTGQNIGAKKDDRVTKGLKIGIEIAVAFAIIVLVLFIFFSESIVGCFVNGEEVVAIASKAIIITALFYSALGVIHVTRGFLNGAGDTGYALVNGLTEVVCRVGLSIVLTSISFIGYWGIWLTTCFTWLATAIISFLRYKSGKWKLKYIISKDKNI